MQELTTVSLQMGFSGLQQDNLVSPNLIEVKEERVEGLGGFEPPTCGFARNSRDYPQNWLDCVARSSRTSVSFALCTTMMCIRANKSIELRVRVSTRSSGAV